ncbi:Srd anti-sigma factor [Pseudomonas phage PspYZU05]|uniref:Anti-sigma factor n=1 Tax=Pseudomonas phage PspYZU05 TaxID=1983556 RepID=A0A2U7N2G9_9CAUD|nr:Srd anti-sigma factor [Pseudomonas phage PspYZU05]ASD51985.1 hypothetical protein PspYZU05_33 [Pseudomonas phage PspYZU05]
MSKDVKILGKIKHKRADAKRRGYAYELSYKFMENICSQTVCLYSGEHFSEDHWNERMSLERIDPNKGYIQGNVIPVKCKYNSLRGDLETPEQFKEAIDALRKKLYNQELALSEQTRAKANRENKIKTLQHNIKRCKNKVALVVLNKTLQKAIDNISISDDLIAQSQSRIIELNTRIFEMADIAESLERVKSYSFYEHMKVKRGLPVTCSFSVLMKNIFV